MIKINLSPFSLRTFRGKKGFALYFFHEGTIKQNKLKHEEAIVLFDKMRTLLPNFVLVDYEKFWSLLALGKIFEASQSLRKVITRYNSLIKNFQAVEPLNVYEKNKCPPKPLLLKIYNTLILLNFLNTYVKNPPKAKKMLEDYLIDKTIPIFSKNEFLINKLLHIFNEKIAIIIGKENFKRQRDNIFSQAFSIAIASFISQIFPAFEAFEDYDALELFIKQESEVLEHLSISDTEKLLKYKNVLKLALAKIYLAKYDITNCKIILKEILKNDPQNSTAQKLLAEAEKVVFH